MNLQKNLRLSFLFRQSKLNQQHDNMCNSCIEFFRCHTEQDCLPQTLKQQVVNDRSPVTG